MLGMNPAIIPSKNHWYGSIALQTESGARDGRFVEADW